MRRSKIKRRLELPKAHLDIVRLDGLQGKLFARRKEFSGSVTAPFILPPPRSIEHVEGEPRPLMFEPPRDFTPRHTDLMFTQLASDRQGSRATEFDVRMAEGEEVSLSHQALNEFVIGQRTVSPPLERKLAVFHAMGTAGCVDHGEVRSHMVNKQSFIHRLLPQWGGRVRGARWGRRPRGAGPMRRARRSSGARRGWEVDPPSCSAWAWTQGAWSLGLRSARGFHSPSHSCAGSRSPSRTSLAAQCHGW